MKQEYDADKRDSNVTLKIRYPFFANKFYNKPNYGYDEEKYDW